MCCRSSENREETDPRTVVDNLSFYYICLLLDLMLVTLHTMRLLAGVPVRASMTDLSDGKLHCISARGLAVRAQHQSVASQRRSAVYSGGGVKASKKERLVYQPSVILRKHICFTCNGPSPPYLAFPYSIHFSLITVYCLPRAHSTPVIRLRHTEKHIHTARLP